jgi:hypothetical protein
MVKVVPGGEIPASQRYHPCQTRLQPASSLDAIKSELKKKNATRISTPTPANLCLSRKDKDLP